MPELKHEVHRICSYLNRFPRGEREKILRQEIDKLPADERDIALTLVTTAIDIGSSSATPAGASERTTSRLLSEQLDHRAAKEKVVLVLHGIRTRGAWQKRLAPLLAQQDLIPELLDYGWFGTIPFLIPARRRKKIEWFRDEYQRLKLRYPGFRPLVIAHSFGTYLICRAMQKYAGLIVFDKIILCGSIVRQDYDWPLVFQRGLANKVLNDCGRLDIWAGHVQKFVQDAESSGRDGFNRSVEGKLLQIFHSEWGHSDFFFDLNFENRWIPFLQDKGVDDFEFPPTKGLPKGLIAIATVFVFLITLWVLLGGDAKRILDSAKLRGYAKQATPTPAHIPPSANSIATSPVSQTPNPLAKVTTTPKPVSPPPRPEPSQNPRTAAPLSTPHLTSTNEYLGLLGKIPVIVSGDLFSKTWPIKAQFYRKDDVNRIFTFTGSRVHELDDGLFVTIRENGKEIGKALLSATATDEHVIWTGEYNSSDYGGPNGGPSFLLRFYGPRPQNVPPAPLVHDYTKPDEKMTANEAGEEWAAEAADKQLIEKISRAHSDSERNRKSIEATKSDDPSKAAFWGELH